nr:hypothetical protein [Tanacetum cinerariifolium]
MVLMVERNRGGHLIRRFAEQGNEPDPRDMKIASLKQRIQELERRQEKTRSKRAFETLTGKLYFCIFVIIEAFGRKPYAPYYPGFHGDHHDNPLLTKKTESEPIIWDIRDEEEEYHFVDNYLNFQDDENSVSFLGVVLGVEEESMPVFDTDIKDVIEEEE